MDSATAQIEFDVAEIESLNEGIPLLTADQLFLIGGGQCTTNSI